MKTTLNADGKIAIPEEIRRSDHLAAGDSFDVERLTNGHYLLTKQQESTPRFIVATAKDGLPVIRPDNGAITLQTVKEIESQMP